MNGRRSQRKIEEACRNHTTRQSIGFFLSKAQWDAPQALALTAVDRLKSLGWKPGTAVNLVIDDTQKKKRGKQMDALSKIFLHAEKVYAQGHTILGSAILYRGVVIPYAVQLWVPKSFAERTGQANFPCESLEYRKLTEMAADMIAGFPPEKATVLFDSYYLCPAVAGACQQRGYHYVGVAKKNRNFFADGRDHQQLKLGKYGPGVLQRSGRWFMHADRSYRLAERVGRLGKLGRVKLVFSRRRREHSWICMVTSATRWGVQRVLTEYKRRWSIEVFFKEAKQHLGLGDYQLLRYRGIERYLCLVMIAHLLLTHLGVQAQGAQANKEDDKLLSLPSVPKLQTELRERLWDDTINTMQSGKRDRKIGKKLKDLVML